MKPAQQQGGDGEVGCETEGVPDAGADRDGAESASERASQRNPRSGRRLGSGLQQERLLHRGLIGDRLLAHVEVEVVLPRCRIFEGHVSSEIARSRNCHFQRVRALGTDSCSESGRRCLQPANTMPTTRPGAAARSTCALAHGADLTYAIRIRFTRSGFRLRAHATCESLSRTAMKIGFGILGVALVATLGDYTLVHASRTSQHAGRRHSRCGAPDCCRRRTGSGCAPGLEGSPDRRAGRRWRRACLLSARRSRGSAALRSGYSRRLGDAVAPPCACSTAGGSARRPAVPGRRSRCAACSQPCSAAWHSSWS